MLPCYGPGPFPFGSSLSLEEGKAGPGRDRLPPKEAQGLGRVASAAAAQAPLPWWGARCSLPCVDHHGMGSRVVGDLLLEIVMVDSTIVT